MQGNGWQGNGGATDREEGALELSERTLDEAIRRNRKMWMGAISVLGRSCFLLP